MAYLNFRDPFQKPGDETPPAPPVSVEFGTHPKLQWKATFTFPDDTRLKMTRAFRDLLNTDNPGSEIRMDFPAGWTLFWKAREADESRLLLAHPEKEEWVATFVLSRALLETVRKNFESGLPFLISEAGLISKLSNIEFEAKFS